jgi:hypothetical protein
MPTFKFTQTEIRAYDADYYIKALTKEEATERMDDYDYDEQGDEEFIETVRSTTYKIKQISDISVD